MFRRAQAVESLDPISSDITPAEDDCLGPEGLAGEGHCGTLPPHGAANNKSKPKTFAGRWTARRPQHRGQTLYCHGEISHGSYRVTSGYLNQSGHPHMEIKHLVTLSVGALAEPGRKSAAEPTLRVQDCYQIPP